MITAGATCLDITPPLGTMIPGLFHDRFAERVHDPLHVRGVPGVEGQPRPMAQLALEVGAGPARDRRGQERPTPGLSSFAG